MLRAGKMNHLAKNEIFGGIYLRNLLSFSASMSTDNIGIKLFSSMIPMADVESIYSPVFVSKNRISISQSLGKDCNKFIKFSTFILLYP